MAVEAKRGCGFRKIGGLYLVGGGIGMPCDRLPFPLTVCPCCSQGVKQALGFTWIDVAKFFQGPHTISEFRSIATGMTYPCYCKEFCPLCRHPETMGRAGLIWIGEKFYKFPVDFVKEGVELGFSRRIKAIPHGFKIGETWVLLAHSKAVFVQRPADSTQDLIGGEIPGDYKPGIFYVWLPQRIEKIVKESTRGTEEIEALEKRGISPVFVPDNDPDHQGNVHDDFEKEQKQKKLLE